MNKKFTLLAAALMTVGTFTAASAASDDWTVGNYYYLKSGNKYLSLDGNKADSVVVKEITSFENVNKAARDSALWEITGITEFINLRTKRQMLFYLLLHLKMLSLLWLLA